MKTEGTPHETRYRTYVRVWLGLLILTGATVSLAGMNLGRLAILSALLIAGAKSGLVLLYFMHLKSERLSHIQSSGSSCTGCLSCFHHSDLL